MELKKYVGKGAIGLMLIAIGGCYEYPPPASGTLGETYTQRPRGDADKLLEGISDLTLADAQRIAVINNPTYIAAAHAVSAARMRYYQAMGAYSPTIGAEFTLQNAHNWTKNTHNVASNPQRTDRFSTSTGINANWLVFDSLAREFTLLAASHSLDYQRMLEADECRTLMRAVAYAYNQVLLAIENKRIALEDRDFQQSSLQYTQLKYQAGAVPLSDVLNFEIQRNAAESNLVQADYQYETAVYALAVLMGYPDGTLPQEIKFASDFKTNFSDLPSVDIYLDTALANRPDLKGYREQLEVAKYQMYQTYSAYGPTINAFATLAVGTQNNTYVGSDSYERSSGYYRHSRSTTPALSYGFTADWTIFNGLIRYNKMREYQANVAVADYQVSAMWMTVVEEVRTAYANYIQSVKQTRIYEKTRDLSAQQRDLVDEGYRAGNTELTRLNEAQRDLVEAETNLASSYINIQNAKAQLDAAVAVNPASFYRDPANIAPGKLENTPVPGMESVDVKPSEQTAPVSAPDNSIIPGTAGPGMSSAFPAPKNIDTTTPVVPIPAADQPKAPATAPAKEPEVSAPASAPQDQPVPIPASSTAPPPGKAPAGSTPVVVQP